MFLRKTGISQVACIQEKTMSTKISKRLLFAGAVSALAAGIAVAQPMGGDGGGCGNRHGGHHEMRHGGTGGGPMIGGDRMFRNLNLTDTQEDRLFELKHAQMPQTRQKMRAARDAREALRKLALIEPYDAAKAKQLAATQAQAMTDLALMRTEFTAQAMAILTPEQRKQIADRTTELDDGDDTTPPRIGRWPR